MTEPPNAQTLVAQNAETIAAVRARADGELDHHQRAIEKVTAVVGRPASIYTVLLAVSAWVGLNVALPAMHVHPIDPPPFYWLQGCVALAGLITAIMVLTTQNRQTRHAEERAQLDLQVNLVSEQKATKIIALLEELRHDMPDVRDRDDPIALAMSEAVDPHAVMSALKDTFEASDAGVDEPPTIGGGAGTDKDSAGQRA